MASTEDGHGACKVGKLSYAKLIARMKGLAMNPLSFEFSPSELRAVVKHTIHVRKAMAMDSLNFPQRKRKLEVLLKDNSRPCLSDQSKLKVSKGLNSSNSSQASFLLTSRENEAISQSTPTRKHFQPSRRSARSQDIVCDENQRSVIPVGPRFQADIPEWIGPTKAQDNVYKHETSKWISSRTWSCEVGRVQRAPGKGRLGVCSRCLNPGSIDCVQRHVVEERLILPCDLGSAFFQMKIDQHGDQISKAWTKEEQCTFQSFATKKPMHDDRKNFLKHAFKCFPSKCRKTIMNYYFNVYLPRHMGYVTRASKKLDTDDEVEEDVICAEKTPCGEDGSNESKNKFLRL